MRWLHNPTISHPRQNKRKQKTKINQAKCSWEIHLQNSGQWIGKIVPNQGIHMKKNAYEVGLKKPLYKLHQITFLL